MPHPRGWDRRDDPRTGEPTPIGQIVDGLLDRQIFARGMPVARLVADWPNIVGPRLSAETVPAELEGGVLTIHATTGPWGMQAGFLKEEIRRRADEALGGGTIEEVRVVVRNSR
jgi:hypothetical protein